jgi:hypothetical protein
LFVNTASFNTNNLLSNTSNASRSDISFILNNSGVKSKVFIYLLTKHASTTPLTNHTASSVVASVSSSDTAEYHNIMHILENLK